MSESSSSTRARVLGAIRATPSLTRKQWLARQVAWLSAALLIFLGLAAGHGMTPLSERPSAYLWMLSVSFGAVVLLLATSMASFLLTPLGPSRTMINVTKWATVPTLALGALLANALAPETLRWPAPGMWVHAWCPLVLLLSGTAVGWLALRATRCVDPITPRASARTIGAFVGALAALAVSIQCDFADPLHVLATHVLPVGLLMGGMARWGARFHPDSKGR